MPPETCQINFGKHEGEKLQDDPINYVIFLSDRWHKQKQVYATCCMVGRKESSRC